MVYAKPWGISRLQVLLTGMSNSLGTQIMSIWSTACLTYSEMQKYFVSNWWDEKLIGIKVI